MPPEETGRAVAKETVPEAVRVAAERLPEKRPLPWTERRDEGEEVPSPTFPPVVAKYAEPVEPIWVVEALPRVVRPETFKVEVAVSAPPKKEGPLV